MMFYKKVETKIGDIFFLAKDEEIHFIVYEERFLKLEKEYDLINESNAVIDRAVNQVEEYLNGKRTSFDLPLKFEGTEFQKKAWTELCNIPYGETISYGTQSKNIGNKNAVRAIGSANRENPISIVIPCHRVIGKSGGLTGYAGGIEAKEKLLNLEKVNLL